MGADHPTVQVGAELRYRDGVGLDGHGGRSLLRCCRRLGRPSDRKVIGLRRRSARSDRAGTGNA
jgi:hypothetical protein